MLVIYTEKSAIVQHSQKVTILLQSIIYKHVNCKNSFQIKKGFCIKNMRSRIA